MGGWRRRENIFQGTDNHYNYVKISSSRKHWHQKRNLNKETVFWNLDINMQKWMKVQCSLLLISFVLFLFFCFFFCQMKSMRMRMRVSESVLDDFFWGEQAFCYRSNNMNTYSISFFFFSTLGSAKATLFVLGLCAFRHINKNMRGKVNTFQ